MKPLFLVILLGLAVTEAHMKCDIMGVNNIDKWQSMDITCVNKMKRLVQMELIASMSYFAMGSHFLQSTVNRAGFGKFFLHSATKERQQAIKFMEYLIMRGELTGRSDYHSLIDRPLPSSAKWRNGVEALNQALEITTALTSHITNTIKTCEEGGNAGHPDFHLVSWLSLDVLGEQYKSQQELANKISELGRMTMEQGTPTLAEFQYDISHMQLSSFT